MKYTKLFLPAFFVLVYFVAFSGVAMSQRNEYVALYRLYNNETRDHLYTTNCDEKDDLVRRGTFVYEGITGYVATRSLRRTVPLYRMLLKNGAHFYTSDYQEMNDLTRDGHASEGVVGYLADSQQRNTVPLYRLFKVDRHLYTTDEREKNDFQRSGGRLEPEPGYIWTSGRSDCDYDDPPAVGNFPVLYGGEYFDGASETLDRDASSLRDWNRSARTIRSIRVPRGWYLVLYSRNNFRGESYQVNNDITFAPGDKWYNNIRSIKVFKGRPPR